MKTQELKLQEEALDKSEEKYQGVYFIQKPFSGEELAVKTREILGEPRTVMG